MSTPRYIVKVGEVSDMPTYEFPLQAMTRSKPTASLVVETEQGFLMALVNALSWAASYSVKQHLPVYPKVRYGSKGKYSMVKKVVGRHAYIENANRAAWVDVSGLSL